MLIQGVRVIRHFAGWLAGFEFWLVAAAVGLSILSERFLVFCAVLGVALWWVRWVGSGRPAFSLPVNGPILIILLVLLLSTFITPLFDTTLVEDLRLISGILLFYAMIHWTVSARRITGLLWGVLGLSLILSVGALFFVNWIAKFRFLPAFIPNELVTALAGSINPNVMAGTLILPMAGMSAFGLFRWQTLTRPAKIGLGAVLLWMGLILILTQSRGALIALAASLGTLCMLRFKRGWMLVLAAAILVAMLVILAGPRRVWYSLGGATGGVATFDSREEIWLRAGLILRDFPLTGVGMGNFGRVVDALYPLAPEPVQMPHAHNLFLQIAVDLGLPGLLAWLACWGAVWVSAWHLFRRRLIFWRALGAAALCSQVALGAGGLLDCVTWDTRPAVIVWGLWGLIIAADRLCRAEAASYDHLAGRISIYGAGHEIKCGNRFYKGSQS